MNQGPVLRLFILLLLIVPLVELYLLIEVGQVIGALPTVALCVLTAVAGGVLLRYQGLTVMFRAQGSIARGEVPAIEMIEGVALAAGGLLLMTPGLATDLVGLLCLLPWSRRAAVRALLRRMQVRGGPPTRGGPGQGSGQGSGGRTTLEGDYRRRDWR